MRVNKTAMLLTALGRGDYDFEEWTWQPYTNGVYSFDVEVFDVEKMYTDFLLGISALDEAGIEIAYPQLDVHVRQE